MSRMFTAMRLQQENLAFAGTGGVSQNNRKLCFQPGFRDSATGRIELARYEDGSLAPMHLLSGLPEDWIVQRDAAGAPVAVLTTIVAGFVRDSIFYTREEAAALV